MIKTLLSFIIVTCIALNSCNPKVGNTRNAMNDSIEKYLDLASVDTLDSVSVNSFNDRAFSLIDLSANDTITRFYLSKVSYNYMRVKNKKALTKIGKIHFQKSSEAKDTLNLARYYRYKAGFYKNTFVNDSSFYNYTKAEKLYKSTNDLLGLGIVYQHLGDLQYDNHDYLAAKLTTLKAYHIYKRTNNKVRLYKILNQLGIISLELEEFDSASGYFNNAMTIVNDNTMPEKKDVYRIALMNNLALILQKQEKYHEAIQKYNDILIKIPNIKDYSLSYSYTIENLAMCKLFIKNYKNVNQLFSESLSIRRKKGNPYLVMQTLFHIAEYNKRLNNNHFAEKFGLEGLDIAIKSKNRINYLFALRSLVNLNDKYLSKYCLEYTRINDSIQIAERKSRNNFATIQLETDEISKEKRNAIKQKSIVIIVSTLVILFVVLLLIITKQRNKQKQLKLLQLQQKSNEDIYHLMLVQKEKEETARDNEKRRIARDLHDGVMNRLSSTKIGLQVFISKQGKENISEYQKYINDLNHIESEIRNISHDLSQNTFQSLDGFQQMLEDLIEGQGDTLPKFVLSVDDKIDWNTITNEIKMNLYRIIQEAIRNIIKYADAENAFINFEFDKPNLCISVMDDGVGFDTSLASKGIGIQNMKDRVKLLKGKLEINSVKGNTSINISVPL